LDWALGLAKVSDLPMGSGSVVLVKALDLVWDLGLPMD
jgi:hypothetical protein